MKRILPLWFFGCFIALLCFGCRPNTKGYNGVSFFTKDIDLSAPLEDRIQAASADVISWLVSFEISDTYKPYMPSADEKQLFADFVQLLSEKYVQLMEEKVIAIFFIEDFEGSGMTMVDFDKKENIFIVLFFNPEIFSHTITEWINMRENSFFDSDLNSSISAECSGHYSALLFALVHEASHIYDYYHHVTPFTEPGLRNKSSPEKTDFTDGAWEDYYQPVKGYDFPFRSDLFAWGLGPVKSRSLAIDIYGSLSKTPFASLYASLNWAEDFAEAFTWFYLGKYLDCDYRVEIKRITDMGDGAFPEEAFLYEPMLNPLLTERFDTFSDICN